MIGHFSNKIKSRKHPEENLLNRYLRGVATRGVGFGRGGDEDDSEDDSEANVDPHPLVRQDARNSSAMIDRTVVWPTRSSAKTQKHRLDVIRVDDGAVDAAHTADVAAAAAPAADAVPAAAVISTNDDIVRLRMQLYLGAAECLLHAGKSAAYEVIDIISPVRVGIWKFGLKEREVQRRIGKTRTSWFRIRMSKVPQYRNPAPDSDDFFYGRIQRFTELTVRGWRDAPYQLAHVELYVGSEPDASSGLVQIDTQILLKCVTADGHRVPISYVQVKDLDSCIAVAERTCEYAAPTDEQLRAAKGHYWVLPIEM